jgi:hypothetical protein
MNKTILALISSTLIIINFAGCGPKSSPDVDKHTVELLQREARSLVGNRYSAKVRIESLLASSAAGRVYSVKLDTGEFMAVYAPANLSGFNPEKGQFFRIEILVDQYGVQNIIVAKKI